MTQRTLRNLLYAFLVLLVPVAYLAMKFDPYQIDGDAMNYMDIAGYLRAHNWAAVVNGYWHPLYPACLALAQMLYHSTRWNELRAYYFIDYVIFFAEVAAMWVFLGALDKLRTRTVTPTQSILTGSPLFSLTALRLLGLGLLLIATQRELSLGKVRPDALLQALMLLAFASLMYALAAETLAASVGAAAAMGVFFALAYLTKSFAFAISLLSIAVMVGFGVFFSKRSVKWAACVALAAIVPFALIAGPWVSALSHKYGHLDFGDSGALNYAWYSGDTEKMHLEPWMTSEFGTADVHLVHPEKQLLATPGVYSYSAVPYGEYPVWFDATYFNQGVKPHIKLRPLLKRDMRNVVLVVRYLLNHPEAWLLFFALLLCGAKLRPTWTRSNLFALPLVLLGLAMWFVYGLVNIEERYVTLAYFAVILPVFAMLRTKISSAENEARIASTAAALVALLAFVSLGESLRVALEARRVQPPSVPVWRDPAIFGAAEGLNALGVGNGDEIACMGTTACLHDPYWMRLANVRNTTEIFAPDATHLLEAWNDLPTRQEAIATVKNTGAKVLVAYFNPGERANTTPAAIGFVQLGETPYWALPLNIPTPPQPVAPVKPWVGHAQGNQ